MRRFSKLAADTQDGRLADVRRLVSGLGRVEKERNRSLAARCTTGIAVFESHEEAEAEAARLSAKMNSDPSCKAKFAYEARELPPALLYRRAA